MDAYGCISSSDSSIRLHAHWHRRGQNHGYIRMHQQQRQQHPPACAMTPQRPELWMHTDASAAATAASACMHINTTESRTMDAFPAAAAATAAEEADAHTNTIGQGHVNVGGGWSSLNPDTKQSPAPCIGYKGEPCTAACTDQYSSAARTKAQPEATRAHSQYKRQACPLAWQGRAWRSHEWRTPSSGFAPLKHAAPGCISVSPAHKNGVAASIFVMGTTALIAGAAQMEPQLQGCGCKAGTQPHCAEHPCANPTNRQPSIESNPGKQTHILEHGHPPRATCRLRAGGWGPTCVGNGARGKGMCVILLFQEGKMYQKMPVKSLGLVLSRSNEALKRQRRAPGQGTVAAPATSPYTCSLSRPSSTSSLCITCSSEKFVNTD
eukprot:1137220-Pelagomonas_calceolata.AAC.5